MNVLARYREGAQRIGPVGEVALVAVLASAWVIAWSSIHGAVGDLSPGGQALFLVNAFTAENLTIGLVAGLLMVVALPLRHRSPTLSLIVVGVLGIALQWWYPLLVTASLVARISVAVAVLWVTWKVRQWWWPVALTLLPLMVANAVRIVQINERNAVLTNGPSPAAISVSAILQEVLLFAFAFRESCTMSLPIT